MPDDHTIPSRAAPPVRLRWLILLIVWTVGLMIWLVYLAIIGYALMRIVF